MDQLVPQPNPVQDPINSMVEALLPEYLKQGVRPIQGNEGPGKVPAVEPMNFAPFLTADIVSNGVGSAAKGLAGAAGKFAPGIFAGIGAKTADRAAYDMARALRQAGDIMMEAGYHPVTGNKVKAVPEIQKVGFDVALRKHIQDKTGWFQAPDQRWKFPITDTQMQVVPSVVGDPWSNLQDVLWHPALYKAYPAFENVKAIVRTGPGRGQSGHWDPNNRLINVMGQNPSVSKSVMAHELQHGVQDLEGFAPGSSPHHLLEMMHSPAELNRMNPDTYHRQFAKARDVYLRHGGEAEARDVGARVISPAREKLPPGTTYDMPSPRMLYPASWLAKQSPETKQLLQGNLTEDALRFARGKRQW